MATAGTKSKSDPHLVVVTVDGARGSQAQSVARLAFFFRVDGVFVASSWGLHDSGDLAVAVCNRELRDHGCASAGGAPGAMPLVRRL
eukprot:scaffold32277_cov108-Isochrysis_galbana.AAC.4